MISAPGCCCCSQKATHCCSCPGMDGARQPTREPGSSPIQNAVASVRHPPNAPSRAVRSRDLGLQRRDPGLCGFQLLHVTGRGAFLHETGIDQGRVRVEVRAVMLDHGPGFRVDVDVDLQILQGLDRFLEIKPRIEQFDLRGGEFLGEGAAGSADRCRQSGAAPAHAADWRPKPRWPLFRSAVCTAPCRCRGDAR